jgi:hypothetical protein
VVRRASRLIPAARAADEVWVTSFFPEPAQPADPADAPAFGSVPPARPPAQVAASRWAKSDVSFGPVGRMVGTVLLLAVGAWLLVFSLIGAGVWWLVVVPWALRDLWRPVRRARG